MRNGRSHSPGASLLEALDTVSRKLLGPDVGLMARLLARPNLGLPSDDSSPVMSARQASTRARNAGVKAGKAAVPHALGRLPSVRYDSASTVVF